MVRITVSLPCSQPPSISLGAEMPSSDQIFEDLFGLDDSLLSHSLLRDVCLQRPGLGNKQKSNKCQVTNTSDTFKVVVDVSDYSQDELSVTASEDDRTVTVRGQHEEKSGEQGFACNTFIRRFDLPAGASAEDVVSELKGGCKLVICVPKKPAEPEPSQQEKVVFIVRARASSEESDDTPPEDDDSSST